MKKPHLSDIEPLVLKEEEYLVFLGLVGRGLWKNNVFIADLIQVNEETIASWKKRKEVIELRQVSVRGDLERWKRSSDPEKRLKEQGMEFETDKLNVSMKIEVKGLENI